MLDPMSLDPMSVMKDLNDTERLMFQNEFNTVKKNSNTGIVLALFLGGFGAHHFYMGNIFLGVLYLLFMWTLIPFIVALIECFLIPTRVREYNWDKAREIIKKIEALRSPVPRHNSPVLAR